MMKYRTLAIVSSHINLVFMYIILYSFYTKGGDSLHAWGAMPTTNSDLLSVGAIIMLWSNFLSAKNENSLNKF